MRKNLFLVCLPLLAFSGASAADELQMTTQTTSVEVETVEVAPAPPAPPASLPARGTKMKAVEKQYGAPSFKHPAAGGGKRKQPPITRWDYAEFSVFFERNKVIDAVVPSHPAPLHTVEGLQPVN